MAELIVAQVLAAGELLIERRVDDRQLLAEELFLNVKAMVNDLLLRCGVNDGTAPTKPTSSGIPVDKASAS